MSFSRRSSAAFGSSQGPGGDSLAAELGDGGFGESLADELDGLSDDDGEVLEEEEEEDFGEDGEDGGVGRDSRYRRHAVRLIPVNVSKHHI